jgi:ElaB/YqjD/DUF883 family membrane-anchored ribosome-binding protein
MKATEVSMQHLVNDLKAVSRDSAELLQATAGDAREAAAGVRNRLAQSLKSARATCDRLQEKTVAAAKKVDTAARQHPYQTAGIAFGVGILLGALVVRRRRNGAE